MDFTITEELKQHQALVRTFIQKELLPLEREVEERDVFPEDLRRRLRKKAVELGLWNYYTPVKFGGAGLGGLALVLVCQELGKVSIALGQQGGVIGVARESFLFDANDAQKEKYLYPYLRGEKEFFIAITEPNAGSDTSNIVTTAVKRGDRYILNGTKTLITMAQRSDFGVILAVTDLTKRKRGGITCFFVDKGTPGFSVSRKLPTMGRRGLDTCELSFIDCAVPKENILGEEGRGLKVALRGLVEDRLIITGCCLGAAQRVYEMSVDYARQRITFSQPLAKRQMIQSMILNMARDIWAVRMMVYNTAWEYDQGLDVRVKAAMVKAFAAEMACRAVDSAMQIHGGYGYCKDMVLEMIYRDVRASRMGGGAVEVLESWAASQLLGVPFEEST